MNDLESDIRLTLAREPSKIVLTPPAATRPRELKDISTAALVFELTARLNLESDFAAHPDKYTSLCTIIEAERSMHIAARDSQR